MTITSIMNSHSVIRSYGIGEYPVTITSSLKSSLASVSYGIGEYPVTITNEQANYNYNKHNPAIFIPPPGAAVHMYIYYIKEERHLPQKLLI